MVLLQQTLQLASPNARLQHPLSSNEFKHLVFILGNTFIPFSLLIKRLLTVIEISTSMADCDAITLFFFDDLPQGFFTRLTP